MQAPTHIAIIMDGNGRWAQQRKLPRIAGHHRGVDAVRNIVQSCLNRKIPILTLFAFSSENWNRPANEVKVLINLLNNILKKEVAKLQKYNIKLCIIGDLQPLPVSIKLSIRNAELLTNKNSVMQLNIALNYGGRWDILNATRKIANKTAKNELDMKSFTEKDFSKYLSTAGCTDPDLLIRTSGEQRISNFLLWQISYSEIYFTNILWPDFNDKNLNEALNFYGKRKRRFGLVE